MDYGSITLLIKDDSDEADAYLEAVIRYLAATDCEKAYKTAGDILRRGDGRSRHRRVRAALLFLMDDRSEETEQQMADFYVNHEEHDENMELVNSYWKKEAD